MSIERMTGPPKQRRRRSLADDELVELALTRFSPSGLNKVAELADASGRAEAVVIRAITAAFKKGLVTVVANNRRAPVRVGALERALTEHFGLLGAVVVDHAVGASEDLQLDAEIHQALGEAMANVIAAAPVFKDGDVIGVSSGRAVHFAVDGLASRMSSGAKGVTILSLSGILHPRDHTRRRSLRFDADTNVLSLASAFSSSGSMEYVSQLLVTADDSELERARSRTWLGRDEFTGQTLALVGVGVFAPGHRLYEPFEDEEGSRRDDPVLAPIIDELQELARLSSDARTSLRSEVAYYPVADICNHLFFVPPSGSRRLAQEGDIRAVIEAINARLLAVKPAQLAKAQTIILIAGTQRKAGAIETLLKHSGYAIRYLCTDSKTANSILEKSRMQEVKS